MQDLLATLATWHGYAKLRLHTDSTVASLRVVTVNLGHLLRRFSMETANEFSTVALPSEEAVAARKYTNALTRAAKAKEAPPAPPESGKQKRFNMNTAKLNFLGDYVDSIPQFGTTDSYSTQVVSVCTRRGYRAHYTETKTVGRVRALPSQAVLQTDQQESLRRTSGPTRSPPASSERHGASRK